MYHVTRFAGNRWVDLERPNGKPPVTVRLRRARIRPRLGAADLYFDDGTAFPSPWPIEGSRQPASATKGATSLCWTSLPCGSARSFWRRSHARRRRSSTSSTRHTSSSRASPPSRASRAVHLALRAVVVQVRAREHTVELNALRDIRGRCTTYHTSLRSSRRRATSISRAWGLPLLLHANLADGQCTPNPHRPHPPIWRTFATRPRPWSARKPSPGRAPGRPPG